MSWLRKMKRTARCRKKYGRQCPHMENHSGRSRKQRSS